MQRARKRVLWGAVGGVTTLGMLVAAVQCLPCMYTDYDAVYLTREGGAEELLRFIEKTLSLPSLPLSASDPHLYAGGGIDPNQYGAFTVDPVDVPALLGQLGLSAEDRTTEAWSSFGLPPVTHPEATRSWFTPADKEFSVWIEKVSRGRRTWLVDEKHGRFWFCYYYH